MINYMDIIFNITTISLYAVWLIMLTYTIFRYNGFNLLSGMSIIVLLWRGYFFGTFIKSFSNIELYELLNGPLTKIPTYIIVIVMLLVNFRIMREKKRKLKEALLKG